MGFEARVVFWYCLPPNPLSTMHSSIRNFFFRYPRLEPAWITPAPQCRANRRWSIHKYTYFILLHKYVNRIMITYQWCPEMQLTVGTVGPRGQNFRGSGKWRLCVRPNDRQTFLLLGAVKNQISVGPGYLLDTLSEGSLIIVNKVKSRKQIGKHFCSFLFMLNFGNQFPFWI